MKSKIYLSLFALISVLIFGSWSRITETYCLTLHHAFIDGEQLQYKATAGSIRVHDTDDRTAADIFYVAYQKNGLSSSQRPITFVFNGGPGSASVWLHMGSFAPIRVKFKNSKGDAPLSDFQYQENPYSWLGFTDLVFIDPVSTGYSRAAEGSDPKQFYGYDQDIHAIAKFITRYLDQNQRGNSPLFIAGESYGAARAVGLTDYLQTHLQVKVSGITLISPALNYELLNFRDGNNQPYAAYLPTYALTAQYHHMLDPALEKLSPEVLYDKAAYFAKHAFTIYLSQHGTAMPALLVDSIHYYTGLSRTLITQTKGRISDNLFMNNVLGENKLVTGCFDSRFTGKALQNRYIDPSETNIRSLFLSSFNKYIHEGLNYKTDRPYRATINPPWNYGSGAVNGFLNVSYTLEKVIINNPSLRVNVICGYYDLSTPMAATKEVINHLKLSPALRPNIRVNEYKSGHMVYIGDGDAKFKTDAANFYKSALAINSAPVFASAN
ncbi:carboxypeptidase C (cathepsin A) [Mucilaginibacter gracilis]|uniref:Carboxypeptidase C (Cathepsin A) n=1 Tax=Mucilaginibacter gracilis TaxID=423350 RepID=A0A495JAP2_9SPHI|nr:peptidase S10 [Mucilaginibacter gracilis]RKR85129.1 carboxypeptidase C (cathepsin A) [Mucilaginibacter gracilis]